MAVLSARRRRAGKTPATGSLSTVLLGLVIVAVVLAVLGIEARPARLPAFDQPGDWQLPLAQTTAALAAGDVGAALAPWHEARRRAIAARRWEGLVEVGEVYRRLGAAGGFGREADAMARKLYLAALWRARAVGSLEGALRAGEAFAALGDREIVTACLEVARTLAGNDAVAQDLVLQAASRWNALAGETGIP